MAYNSTIKQKLDFCIDCNDKTLKACIAKRCRVYHYKLFRTKVSQARAKERDVEHRVYFDELNVWFAKIAKEVIAPNPYCMECKTFIPEKFYRHATAHIFEKAIFRSVATHPLNYLILGAGCGCHDKTGDWEKFSEMKIWTLAFKRIQIIYPLITEKRKNSLPKFILNQII